MNTLRRSVCAAACIVAVMAAEGCRARGLGSLSRAAARTSRAERERARMEEAPPYLVEEVTEKDLQELLAEDREWLPRVRKRYEAALSGVTGAAQLDVAVAAWQADAMWDKPKPERMATTLSTLFADTAGKSLGLTWAAYATADDSQLILADKERQVLVFADDIILEWLEGKRPGYSVAKLTKEITEAFRPATPRPAFIGIEPPVMPRQK